MSRSPSLPRVPLVLALGLYSWLVSRTWHRIDDAYISFQYARNWAEGHGLVFHGGGGGLEGPVEGYSNFGWIALLALLARFGLAPEDAALIVSCGAGAGTVVLVGWLLAVRCGLGEARTTIGLALLVGSAPFVVWTTGGLETSLFTFLLLLLFALSSLEDRGRGAALGEGVVAACIVLLRVEGLAWVVVVLLATLGFRRRRGGGVLPASFVVALVACGLHTAWRLSFYGDPLPIAAHSKLVPESQTLARGLRYVLSFGLLTLAPLLAVMAIPWMLGKNTHARLGRACLPVLAAFLVFNVAVGGDWMPFFRFFAPATPFLVLVLCLAGTRMPEAVFLWVGGAVVAMSLLPLYGRSVVPRDALHRVYFRAYRAGYQSEYERLARSRDNLQRYITAGKALSRIARPEDTVVANAIGAVAYHSGLRVLDRNGLIDREVARAPLRSGPRTAGHERRVARSFFVPRKPTYFEAMPVSGDVVDEGAPGHMAAVRQVAGRVFESDAERVLLECSLPVLYPIEHLGEPATLVTLRWCDDAVLARSTWAGYGF